MNILFLSQILPYPPDAGPKVKSWHVLKYLTSKDHEITLVSFVRPDEKKHLPELERKINHVLTVPIERSRLKDAYFWLRSLIRGTPFLVERDDRIAMRRLVKKLLKEQNFDAIHADQLTMTQYSLPGGIRNGSQGASNQGKGSVEKRGDIPDSLESKPIFIFDAHNATWTILRRMFKTSPFLLRPFLALEEKRLKMYEGRIVHTYSHTLAVSEIDRQALSDAEKAYCMSQGNDCLEPTLIHVIPITVDVPAKTIKSMSSSLSPPSILILGTLHYPPNADGVRWFVNEIFPRIEARIPNVKLTIIGKNPPDDLKGIARAKPDSILLTGYVKDLRPYIESTDIMVVPVRVGGGMRVRILEGFSWGIPMVTTTVGLEGIDAVDKKDILIANDVQNFEDAVCILLESEHLRATLSENGRKLVASKYKWGTGLKKLDQIYE